MELKEKVMADLFDQYAVAQPKASEHTTKASEHTTKQAEPAETKTTKRTSKKSEADDDE